MDEEQLIEGLQWCLEHAMLSGAERELCERLIYAGAAELAQNPMDLRRAREVLLWHGWRG
jgi:hypothetical protein